MNYSELIEEMIAARDFCSERNVLAEWESEHGKLGPYALQKVFAEVEKQWTQAQANAGVTKPIGAQERRHVNRSLR